MQLYEAIKTQNELELKVILSEANLDLNAPIRPAHINYHENPTHDILPLRYAVIIGNLNIFLLLLAHGADLPNYENDCGQILFEAASRGYTTILLLLCGIQPIFNQDNDEEQRLLSSELAPMELYTNIVKEKLVGCLSFNKQYGNYYPPLYYVLQYAHSETLKAMLDHGADIGILAQYGINLFNLVINNKIYTYYTHECLVYAEKMIRDNLEEEEILETLNLLLPYVSNLNATQYELTDAQSVHYAMHALHYAAKNNYPMVIEFLVKKCGVPVDLPAYHNECNRCDSSWRLKTFFDMKGVNLKYLCMEQPFRVSPLYFATRWGRVDACRKLLTLGADPLFDTHVDSTSIHTAAMESSNVVLELINDAIGFKSSELKIEKKIQAEWIPLVSIG